MADSVFTPEWRWVKRIGNCCDKSKNIEITVDQIWHNI